MADKNKKDGGDRKARIQFPKTIYGFADAMATLDICRDLRWNLFTETPVLLDDKTGKVKPVNDSMLSEIKAELEDKFNLYSDARFNDGWRVLCKQPDRQYHPIRERIEAIRWDEKDHITYILQNVLKCSESAYTKECARLLFAGGIRRLYEPGCKFDTVVVLQGAHQGEGKSTFLRWMALDDDWFGVLKTFDPQKGAEALSNKWIVEIEELAALRKAEIEVVKGFISQQSDNYRRPYERTTSDVKRKCIMAGTTNALQFLSDPTGNRRFLPIEVHSRAEVDLYPKEKEIRTEIEQCWAEAYHWYSENDGYMSPTPDTDLIERITLEQERATVNDPNLDIIRSFLDGRSATCVLEIYYDAFGHSTLDHPTKAERNEIGVLLQKAGWRRVPYYMQYTKPTVSRQAKWLPADAVH